jgi:hypothetical protein
MLEVFDLISMDQHQVFRQLLRKASLNLKVVRLRVLGAQAHQTGELRLLLREKVAGIGFLLYETEDAEVGHDLSVESKRQTQRPRFLRALGQLETRAIDRELVLDYFLWYNI